MKMMHLWRVVLGNSLITIINKEAAVNDNK